MFTEYPLGPGALLGPGTMRNKMQALPSCSGDGLAQQSQCLSGFDGCLHRMFLKLGLRRSLLLA